MPRKKSVSQEEYDHVVVISDTQWPYEDTDAERALQEYVHDTQPQKLVHIGDAADFYSLARFLKGVRPSKRLYLEEEIAYTRAKFKEWADLAPNAEKYVILGNHDERLSRYLETNANELFDLVDDVLDYGTITGATAAGWTVVGPYGEGMWLGKPGGLWATHGQYARSSSGASAKAHVEVYGHSVIHGHTHRLGSYFKHTNLGTFVGIEVGTLASRTKTPRAAAVVDWQYGFGDVWVSRTSARFFAAPVAIVDGGFVLGGKKYGR
jgi:hypothetical protein